MISTIEIVATNMALCNSFADEFEISRPHQLEVLKRRDEQLSGKSNSYRLAYVARGIQMHKPFAHNNTRTAATFLAAHSGKPASQFTGLLKHEADTETLCAALEA